MREEQVTMDDAIRQYYGGKSLSDDRLEAILRSPAPAASRGDRRAGRLYWISGIAAALVVGFTGLHVTLQRATLTDAVLREIAMNHEKGLKVEVAALRYEAVQERLDRLDFSVRPEDADLLSRYDLVGGRYCSIQGGLAAQLKIRDTDTGDLLTLYVTGLTDGLASIAPGDRVFDGVQIRLWAEDGRFFALARDRAPDAGVR